MSVVRFDVYMSPCSYVFVTLGVCVCVCVHLMRPVEQVFFYNIAIPFANIDGNEDEIFAFRRNLINFKATSRIEQIW